MPGQWGGVDHQALRERGLLDEQGWPTRVPPELGSIGTLILTEMPEAAVDLAGRYVLRFKGKGLVEVSGLATAKRYGENEVSFDYIPGPGAVDIRIQRSDPGDPVREITVVRETHLSRFEQGALFNPDWLARLQGFKVLRFMDWLETNNSEQRQWTDRPRRDDATWAAHGVPLEVMIALANETGADMWINVPHLADDEYVREMAEPVRDGLQPDRKVFVEFSNEVWNWQFAQSRWADERAEARWGLQDKWMQFYGLRAAEVAQIWTDVFGSEAAAAQAGKCDLEPDRLAGPGNRGARRAACACRGFAGSG